MNILFALLLGLASANADAARPNIVWIVGEDMGPELGCYGDPNALTPNMDRLAKEGTRYARCFTHAPVCAPCRSGLVTGIYPTTLGTHHMRSTLIQPPRLFTQELRDAGYFVAWPGKTDFNFEVPAGAFDTTKDWTRDPKVLPKGKPFFAYVNFTISHESNIRKINPQQYERWMARLKPEERRDPAKLKLPAYTPDTPITRADLASYYDLVTVVDQEVGRVLKFLDDQGLADNTVVILTGDHGRGLPRSKRWPYEQGTHVPLIVRWPGKVAAGAASDELVAFLDFAPTALSVAGAPIPKSYQGRVFLGPNRGEPRQYAFSGRDRMDETFDRVRAVRDSRYRYIRNYFPELPYAQRISYMEEMPTMREWRRLFAEGKLNPTQAAFFAPRKPREELYDCEADPDNVVDLAADPKHAEKLKELRAALDDWIKRTDDMAEKFDERAMIRRGIVKDRLAEYEKRKATP